MSTQFSDWVNAACQALNLSQGAFTKNLTEYWEADSQRAGRVFNSARKKQEISRWMTGSLQPQNRSVEFVANFFSNYAKSKLISATIPRYEDYAKHSPAEETPHVDHVGGVPPIQHIRVYDDKSIKSLQKLSGSYSIYFKCSVDDVVVEGKLHLEIRSVGAYSAGRYEQSCLFVDHCGTEYRGTWVYNRALIHVHVEADVEFPKNQKGETITTPDKLFIAIDLPWQHSNERVKHYGGVMLGTDDIERSPTAAVAIIEKEGALPEYDGKTIGRVVAERLQSALIGSTSDVMRLIRDEKRLR